MFLLPLYILKPIISFLFSIVFYFGLNVYQSYEKNQSIELPEKRINEAFEKNPLTSATASSNDDRKKKSSTTTQKPIVIITGSTAGIGYSTASELYRLGCHVIIASRSKDKCLTTVDEITKAYPTNEKGGKLDCHSLDIGDFDSVRDFVKWFSSNYSYLTYLINNAGIHYSQGENTKLTKTDTAILSKQGYDEVFATNYMGHFLLTHLLLPLMKKGRILSIASGLHYGSDGTTLAIETTKNHNGLIDAADGNKRGFYHRMNAYGVSKLAQILHMKYLMKQFEKEGKANDIQCISICPGWVKTAMIPTGPMGKIIYRFAFPTRSAVLTPLLSLVDSNVKGGEFFTNYMMPITQGMIGRGTLNLLTKIGLRDLFSAALAMGISLLESLSYGYYKTIPSEEALNDKLAEELYDWTLKEFQKKGYIAKSQ
jgi:NAD(P)-dependent dehydrogenase (short-subunit alcohol dehydrogenase family)